MNWLHYLADFGAGVFVCNGIPHLACGLRGESFPTPFAKPPGFGLSSAMTNTLWAILNLIIGWVLLSRAPFSIGFSLEALWFLAGFVLTSVQLSWHFGSVRKKRDPS
jgi:hypothetical protein